MDDCLPAERRGSGGAMGDEDAGVQARGSQLTLAESLDANILV